MNKKLIAITIIYIVIMCLVCVFLFIKETDNRKNVDVRVDSFKVTLNEIEQKYSAGDTEGAEKLSAELKDDISELKREASSDYSGIIVPVLISAVSVFIILIYLDRTILRPFRRMKDYASDLSRGDFDKPLEVERGNYFGDFTWAFDNMRREIVKSRSAEKEAIENNKTVIATLSHDIKTPVASVRAYAEAFEANMDSTPEKRQKYLSIIMEKCDEVTKLTNDLFLHSISEMNRLETFSEEIELTGFIDTEVSKLFVSEGEAEFKLPENEEILIKADPKRLLQIFENLKNNAEKYAKTKVEISVFTSDDACEIHFRDFGQGIPEEEIPFITGKFYRGKNVGNENGSGLGLYIVKELMSKMGGEMMLLNKEPGLDVVLKFPK